MTIAQEFTKRTTFIVADAVAAAQFYVDVFGFSIWYDNELEVDERFPPCAPHNSVARLIIVKAIDPKIGMLGFLNYLDHQPEEIAGHKTRDHIRLGDPVLVFEVPDLEAVYQRAQQTNARIVTPPARWTVPAPNGGEIELFSMSMFDENGIYSEIGQARDQ